MQERGVDVTVIDRTGVAAGASWGNAGWIAPALTLPLNDPSVLRYGLRSLGDPTAPLHIPLTADGALWAFLMRFAANCRRSSWMKAARANVPISVTALSGNALREQVPLASPAVVAGLNIQGQRFIDPGRFVHALASSVEARGATIRILEITDVVSSGNGVTVYPQSGENLTADAAVIATGAWLSGLVGRRVKVPVRAGRGYSFTVPVDRPLPGPIYLPDARVACTPYQGAMRIAGTMEFRHPHEPIDPERVGAIVDSASPLLDGVRWAERSDIWVGPRPITPDGRPLIGEMSRSVYVAGGHGMWGLAHGPVTGRLLAECITTNKQSEVLRNFNPLR